MSNWGTERSSYSPWVISFPLQAPKRFPPDRHTDSANIHQTGIQISFTDAALEQKSEFFLFFPFPTRKSSSWTGLDCSFRCAWRGTKRMLKLWKLSRWSCISLAKWVKKNGWCFPPSKYITTYLHSHNTLVSTTDLTGQSTTCQGPQVGLRLETKRSQASAHVMSFSVLYLM